jgi:hypothetical protein
LEILENSGRVRRRRNEKSVIFAGAKPLDLLCSARVGEQLPKVD